MSLQFTGTFPIWALLLLFLFTAGLSIYLYRLHQLPTPWNKWLPICRVLVLFLLILTLFQPVIAITNDKKIEGRIPVIVDTSGSMSIKDKYEPPEQIDITWHMEFFDQDLRSTAFRDVNDELAPINEELQAVRKADTELQSIIYQTDDWDKIKPLYKALGKHLDELQDQLSDMHEAITEATEDFDYLSDEDEAETKKSAKASKADRSQAAPQSGSGRILVERFDNIKGFNIEDLTRAETYPDRPDQLIRLKSLRLANNTGENYGVRIRAYLKAPKSGSYVFQVASDDRSWVYLSKNRDPKHKRKICSVDAYTGVDEWTREANQKSRPIKLRKGQTYYFEVLYKEGEGDDHLSVSWRRPDKRFDAAIPDEFFEPFEAKFGLASSGGGDRTPLDFPANHGRLSSQLDDLSSALKVCREELDEVDKKMSGKERAATIKAAMEGVQILDSKLAGLPDLLRRTQRAADEQLALAEIPEVDEALKRFKEMTRADLVKQILYEKPYRLIDKLRDKGTVKLFTFAEEIEPIKDELLGENQGYDQASTRLGSVVHNIVNYFEKQPIAAMVVLSDGNVNAGKPTADAREIAVDNGVPLITIGIGSQLPPDDVAIDHIIAPKATFKDDLLALNVVLKRDGYQQAPIRMVVRHKDEIVHEKMIDPGPEARLVVDMSFEESEGGRRHYVVEAETLDGETLDDNNSKTFTVNVLEDPIQTLLLDEFPRWESRYATMMLERDKRIDVRPIFIGSQKDGVLPVKEGGYPVNREELFKYHIVVLGDVNPEHFSNQQLLDLRDFVVERGGTIMLMAGERYMPNAYENTALAEVFPFSIEPSRAAKPADNEKVWQMDLTDGGRYSELLRVARTPEDSERLWQELPGINWVKRGIRPSSSAEYLVTTEDKQPVMLSAYAGQGKLLYLGGDSFWRWRYRARWTFHHRFWGQILLWATQGRTTGSDKLIKMETNRLEYSPGEPVVVKARILNKEERVLNDASAYVDVFDDKDELVTTLPLIPIENSGGEYRTTVKDLKRGSYRAVPRVSELGKHEFEGDVRFSVKDLPTSEYVDLTLNDTVLKQLGTDYHPFYQANAILDGIEEVDEVIVQHREIEIWDTVYLMLLVAILLGIEWQIRKRSRLL